MMQAWQLWNEGKGLELMDPLLGDSCCPDEFLRCYHIGLLCVQEDAFDRPTMSSVIIMLRSESLSLRQPERPAFSVGRFANNQEIASGSSSSVNGLTASTAVPRWWDCSVSLMSLPSHLYLHLVSFTKACNSIQIWTNCFRNIADFFCRMPISSIIHLLCVSEISLFSYIYNKTNFKLYLILKSTNLSCCKI